MFDKKQWEDLLQDNNVVFEIKNNLGISQTCAKLLYNRGFRTPEESHKFLNKSDSVFYDPFLLKDMEKAVKRLKNAIICDETITIYGDYDVDGITATSMLYLYLKKYLTNVNYYIPTRSDEGYGLSIAAFDKIKENGSTLVVTVDTGSTAVEEVKYANSLGIDILITDHHECPNVLPNAIAVINPCRKDDEYPFKCLSGVGVAFKLLCAFEVFLKNDNYEQELTLTKELCEDYIDFVTLGTVADIMPIIDENRVFTYLGLNMIRFTKNIGLRMLLDAIEIKGKIYTSTISYNIGPKINACGRMGDPSLGVKLLISHNIDEARALAYKLCEMNSQRQSIEQEMINEACLQIEHNKLQEKSVIVLCSDTWNSGIIGLAASKITERYMKPSILISFNDDKDKGKGSVRSTNDINIFEALSECSDLFLKFGGHAAAAGITICRDNIDEFKKRIYEIVSLKEQSIDKKSKQYKVDFELEPYEITVENLQSFANLEPYGIGNQQPIFRINNAKIVELKLISNGKHTKLKVYYKDNFFNAIMYGHNLDNIGFKEGDTIDFIFNMDFDTYGNRVGVNLIIKDIDYSDNMINYISEYQNMLNMYIKSNEMIPNRYLPNRDDFVIIYTKIKSIVNSGLNIISIKRLVDDFNLVNYIKAGIIMYALYELRVIDITKISTYNYEVNLNKIEGKVDLNSAEIIKRISIG